MALSCFICSLKRQQFKQFVQLLIVTFCWRLVVKKKYCFHRALGEVTLMTSVHKFCTNITATSKRLASTAQHKTTSKEPRNIRNHCKKFSHPGNPAHDLCTPAFGDPVYTRTTYIQATINSSFRIPCTYMYNLHSSDHQQQL